MAVAVLTVSIIGLMLLSQDQVIFLLAWSEKSKWSNSKQIMLKKSLKTQYKYFASNIYSLM